MRVLNKGTPIRQLSIDRLIVYHALIFHFYPDGDSLCSCPCLRNGCWEDWARKENTVRNRDTHLRLIETSQDIYIVRCREQQARLQKIQDQSKPSKAYRSKDCATQ
jgi:hypothetical protein